MRFEICNIHYTYKLNITNIPVPSRGRSEIMSSLREGNGEGGVHQNMTDDCDRMEMKVNDKQNHY